MIHFRLDEGRRFSEDTYATKEDVKATYNQENVDPIWENVLSYRQFFDVETDLSDVNKSHYKVCLTKKLAGESYTFQTRLSQDLFKLILLPSPAQEAFLRESEFQALSRCAKSNDVPIAPNTIRKIQSGELENFTSKFYVLKAYSEASKYASSLSSLDLTAIENINKMLSGESLDSSALYRTKDKADVLNPLEKAPVEDIPVHMQELISFLAQEEIPAILRALGTLYFFAALSPFEYYNEETSALTAKAFLKTSGFEAIAFSLDFESIAYSKGEYTNRKLLASEKSLDLTYYLSYFLAYLKMDQESFEKKMDELSDEAKKEASEAQPSPSATLGPNDIPVASAPKEYALPSFPEETDKESLEERARKLREVYPQLKKKQAHFYAGHCTIGLHYTIEQFKECENTVYETARTSMENLANRGFYKKELIGKKFVYTPIPIKDHEGD